VDREMISKKEMFPRVVANTKGNKSPLCHKEEAIQANCESIDKWGIA